MEEKNLLFLLSTQKYSRNMYHVYAPETQTAVIVYFSGLFTILKVSEDEGWENMQNTFEKRKAVNHHARWCAAIHYRKQQLLPKAFLIKKKNILPCKNSCRGEERGSMRK